MNFSKLDIFKFFELIFMVCNHFLNFELSILSCFFFQYCYCAMGRDQGEINGFLLKRGKWHDGCAQGEGDKDSCEGVYPSEMVVVEMWWHWTIPFVRFLFLLFFYCHSHFCYHSLYLFMVTLCWYFSFCLFVCFCVCMQRFGSWWVVDIID